MPQSVLNEAIGKLDQLSADNGVWRPLRNELPALRERVAWLKDQLDQVPAPLVAVLFGGTGAGKSTLLNALAGARIADASEHRPTTDEPTVYHPLGSPQDFGPAKYVKSGHLDGLVLIDLPDTDSIRTEHCERVIEMLERADVVLFCGTQQKYKNEKSMALLRPLKNERKIVCIQTRADEDADIREDWLERLREEGFQIDHCFRVSAVRALGRKLDGESPEDEFEFQELDRYLKEKLPPERIGIKERNLSGAVCNTLDALHRRLDEKGAELKALHERLLGAEAEVARVSLQELQARLMDDEHLWVVALGEAVSERAFGLVGTLFRLLHWLRMLPARVRGKLSIASLMRPAVRGSPPAGDKSADEDAAFLRNGVLRQLAAKFAQQHADVNAYMTRAGFEASGFEQWKDNFIEELSSRLEEYLGPIQRRLERRARRITSWALPILEIVWFAPFAFTVGVPIYQYYWNLLRHAEVVLPEPDFLSRSASMIAIVILIELMAFAYLVRLGGRRLRGRSTRDLAKDFEGRSFGFAKQRAKVQNALERLDEIDALRRACS